MQFSGEELRILLDIARDAIRSSLAVDAAARRSATAAWEGALSQPAGCFVSLHERESRRLRGCVGRLDARGTLIQTVRESAVGVLRDPRFVNEPVRIEELMSLDLELTILSPLRAAERCTDFEPHSQGIYLIVGSRSGCFLPQVARETGWGREQLLERLCTEKLGLAADAWKQPDAKLFTFTAQIAGPEPFEPEPAAIVVAPANQIDTRAAGS